MKRYDEFPALLEAFFTDYLLQQRRASPHTVASYRDTFRLLVSLAHVQLKITPSALRFDHVNAQFIASFLTHIERERGCSVRTRNTRLAALRSFFRFVSFRRPDRAESIRRILATPFKRCERRLVSYLSVHEIRALQAVPNRNTWIGRRDYVLLQIAIQTGLRVSELTSLRQQDVHLGTGPFVRCEGKGRKERAVPLTKQSKATLTSWIREIPDRPEAPLFPSARGTRLSSDGVQHLLQKHITLACVKCPSLSKKRITPHVLRHTTAVQLLHAGVEQSMIALWLGHESIQTTQVYLDADLEYKEKVLNDTSLPTERQKRFHAKDHLLAFLQGL